MGQAWVVGDVLKWSGAGNRSAQDDVDGELIGLQHSFEETLAELDRYAQRIEAEFDSDARRHLSRHGEMLRELFASGEFERELRASLLTAEAAVRAGCCSGGIRSSRRWRTRPFASGPTTCSTWAAISSGGSAASTERALPSDSRAQHPGGRAAAAVGCRAAAQVERGGRGRRSAGQGSHAALLAREKGIPTITEIPGVLSLHRAAGRNFWSTASGARWSSPRMPRPQPNSKSGWKHGGRRSCAARRPAASRRARSTAN